MLPKAKHLELQFAEVKIAAEYMDYNINQLININSSLQKTIDQIELQKNEPSISNSTQYNNKNTSNLINSATGSSFLLKEKKRELDVINKHLLELKQQLQAIYSKKYGPNNNKISN